MAVGGAVVDNIHRGGLGAPVALASGVLGSALTADVSRTGRHPITGATFEGSVVPFWGDVLRLAVRGHEALLPAVVLGFDIAVLEDGPAIVEVNPAPATSEYVTHIPLGRIDELDLLLDHLVRLAT
jgi:hypothetical protein